MKVHNDMSYTVFNANDLEEFKAFSNYVVMVPWTKVNAGRNLENRGSLWYIWLDQWILRVTSVSVSLTSL